MTRAVDDLAPPPPGGAARTGIQSRDVGRGGFVRRMLREHWWVRVLLVFAAGRVVTTTMLLALASVQGPNPWTGAKPSYWDYASIWDGTWYKIIAYWGYPQQLPLGTDGHIGQNAWAFLPGYPFLVRGLTEITTVPWEYTSVFVAFAFGIGSTLLFYRLMRRALSPGTSLFAVALFTLGPSSPMFQVAYAETMGLFFVMLGLHLLLERKYWLLFPVIVAMSLSRPSGLAFALCLALHLGYRWYTRARDPFVRGDLPLAIAATAFSAFMGVFWSLVAWIGTGYFSAYTDTELAWRASYIGYQHLIPFASWFQGGNWWIGAPAGAVVVVILIAAFGLWMATKGVRRLPLDLRFWVIAYAVYLLAVFFPQSSTFRLLIPLFPLLGVMAIPTSRIYRVALIVLFVAAQAGWLLICWGVDGADWTPP